jgi:hypothetical protein
MTPKSGAVNGTIARILQKMYGLSRTQARYSLIKSYRNRFLNHIKFHIRMWIQVHNQKKLSYLQEAEKDEEVVVVVDQEEEETAEEVGHHGMAEETWKRRQR